MLLLLLLLLLLLTYNIENANGCTNDAKALR
jgi:hypothetical protein